MKTLSKRITILFALVFMLLGNVTVFAAPEGQTSRAAQEKIGFVKTEELSKDGIDPGIPSVSSDAIAAYGERKGGEVIGILQTWGQPILIVSFIVGALMAALGFLFKGATTKAGMAAMFFSALSYCVIMYAPEIMDAFLKWARS